MYKIMIKTLNIEIWNLTSSEVIFSFTPVLPPEDNSMTSSSESLILKSSPRSPSSVQPIAYAVTPAVIKS